MGILCPFSRNKLTIYIIINQKITIMRKIFTSLKSVVAATLVAAMAFSVSCSYDDTAINDRVDQVENDLKALTERVDALEKKLGAEVESLKALIDGKVVVVDIITDEAGNQTIKLSDGSEITVLAPAECDCDNLLYRVENGVLEVSADGVNWVAVVQVAPEQVVASVVVNEDGTVTITLATGEEINVGAKAELIEFEAARGQVYVIAGQSKEIPFAINDAVADINIMNQPFGWSATVEEAAEAPEAGDEGGVAPMPLAAGGQNFVLKINGPSQELVNAGYAAKEGVVSVHFNTADGACKVAQVAVNLAEITMTIDTDGNLRIVNTMACEQENYWGEKFVDFADFFIGIMPKSLYDEHGADALLNDFQDWDYTTAAATQRSTGLWNVADLRNYEEGVYEEEIIDIHVDRLAQAFYPTFNFEIGSEYIIFISLESELKNYYEIPVLDNAIMVNYKKVLVSAEYVADSAKWNDATFNFSLAGYDNYLIGWMSVAEANDYINNGMAASIEELLPLYINGYGLMSSGAILAGSYIDQDIKLSELAEMSLMGWAPEVAADTEYHFYVYPFNATTEMEFYQHTLVAENLRYIGTFSTTALAAGNFAVDATYEVVEHVEDNIEVNVTVAEGIDTIVYTWFDQSYADPEEAVYVVLNDVYAEKAAEASFTASKYGYNGLPNPIYLAIVAINADGEYVYVEKEFKYIEPEPIALTSFEYQGRHFDLDDNVETSGGDHVYIAKAVDGTEFTIGLYYTFADENGVITPGEYSYCTNYFNAMYSYWNGFVIVDDAYYSGSKMIVTEDTVKIKIKGGNIYLFDKNATDVEPEPEPEPIEPSASAALVADTTFNGFNPYDVTFSFENGDQVLVRFNTSGNQYLHLGNWQTDKWQEPHYISQVKYNGEYAAITACNVAYENDAYVVTLSVFEYTNYETLNYTFTGAIEGLNAPEACDCLDPKEPENPEGGEGDVINVTIQNLTVGYDQPGEKELQFWYSATNAHVIDFKGFDNCNPGQPVAAGTYSSEDYTIDANYCIFDYGTTNGAMSDIVVVVTDNGDGTYTYDAKFSHSGKKYAFVYTGAFPQ